MKVSFESKGDFEKLSAWLDGVANKDVSPALLQIAKEGQLSLSSNTPKDTGETAAGWTAEITTKGQESEVAWKNVAHPGLTVNLAKLIDQGHGTGTGGYVPPKPYIVSSMDSVWKTAGDKIVKELIE